MTDDVLAREIELLSAEFKQPAHRNVGFVAKRLLDLVAAGHRLADIETALRDSDAPIFLVGLPWRPEMEAGYRLFHPDDSLDDAALQYSLWIGINGQDEVNRVLSEASLSPATNLINLNVTGFLEVDDEEADLPSDPTVAELIDWLLLDAPTWTARRAVVLQHRELLSTDEALGTLDRLAEHVELASSSREVISALSELLRRVSQDGPRLAFQTCQFLVLEALHAFLGAPTWSEAGDVYASYDYELSGDLATEILTEMGSDSKYTAAQRTIIGIHTQVLESAWERGIETAIADAEHQFPMKYGTAAAEDYLQSYLAAPDLEAARDTLRWAPAELFQLDHDAVVAGMRRANTDDDLWRVGLLEDTRDRGVDESYRDWAELRSIEAMFDTQEALQRLSTLLDRHKRCLRDRTLELLLEIHSRVGDEKAQQAIAEELVNHRSGPSPPSRRPLDLVNLGVISSQRGDLATARAAFREARAVVDRVHPRPARAAFWLRVGIFSRDYDSDVAIALHSFRLAAEEVAAADDLVSRAYAFEQLSSLYRSLGRIDVAEVYTILAEQSIGDPDGTEDGIAGSRTEVMHAVENGAAVTQFLLGDYEAAAERVQWLLNESHRQLDDDERVALGRLALACAVESGDWRSARQIVTSWSAAGHHDWASLGRAAITLSRSAEVDRDHPIDPARSAELVGLAEVLGRLGASTSGVAGLLRPSTHGELSRAVVDTLAGVERADPLFPSRMFGDHEAAIWVSRFERAAARTTTLEQNRPTPLQSGAPWSEIIARYDDLGVWEVPDLAVMGPILDRWSLLSRFEDAVRINPVPPCDGCLNVYFYGSDPEGHLDSSVRGCAYLPEDDLIICSLSYLDDLFRVGRVAWDEEINQIKAELIRSNWPDVDSLAISVGNKIRARERILLEWVIAHEIGHAHFAHSGASTGEHALALEDQAESFFLDGIVADGGVGEILLSMFGQLNLLYEYDCEKQLNRALTSEERRDRSVLLDAAPDVSGHRPLVFRAVSLVRSILKIHPELEDDSYIEQFAASLEGR